MPEPTQRHAEDRERLEVLRARNTALEADLEELVHVASHDLTEPLRMVTSYLGLLERRSASQLDDTAREFIHHAVEGAEGMRALLDDLLRYGRAGDDELRREPVDVDALLDTVLRSLGPAIEEAGATVVVQRPLAGVEADAVRVGQLLQNLIANAVKFRAPDRPARVTVGAVRDEAAGAWRLTVADDGIGIEPGQQERIFLIFQRLHVREEYPGTGIGLAICRRIALRLGGTITVASEPGAGSAFTVTIPDAVAAA